MKKAINPKKVYSSREAADMLGVNKRTVTNLCKSGNIVSKKIKEYKILGQNLIDFLNPSQIVYSAYSVKKGYWIPRVEVIVNPDAKFGENMTVRTLDWEEKKFETRQEAQNYAATYGKMWVDQQLKASKKQ